MNFLYNITVYIVRFILNIVALFSKKIKLFLEGRKDVFGKIKDKISPEDKVIWFHSASLGEFEQGRPIIEKIKSQHPDYKIVVTFFSPSGYEIRKNYELADVVTYLPLDTKNNAKQFLNLVHPTIAIFIKYEFWPNILNEIKFRNIHCILVSGIFRSDQVFFKKRGQWMRNSLTAFSHFFVQNDESKKLLESVNFYNSTISGDTRFDRVADISNQDNTLEFIEKFKQNKYTVVAGSSWPKDEELLISYINNTASDDEKFIIAPHNINAEEINHLKNAIQKEVVQFSDQNKNFNASVFIVDTIGILTKIYSYADVAYVGGGFGVSIHNILEPAVFGIPLIIGPNYQKFQEAKDLIKLGSCKSINSKEELNNHLVKLYKDNNYREELGKISKKYIDDNKGATSIVVSYINKELT